MCRPLRRRVLARARRIARAIGSGHPCVVGAVVSTARCLGSRHRHTACPRPDRAISEHELDRDLRARRCIDSAHRRLTQAPPQHFSAPGFLPLRCGRGHAAAWTLGQGLSTTYLLAGQLLTHIARDSTARRRGEVSDQHDASGRSRMPAPSLPPKPNPTDRALRPAAGSGVRTVPVAPAINNQQRIINVLCPGIGAWRKRLYNATRQRGVSSLSLSAPLRLCGSARGRRPGVRRVGRGSESDLDFDGAIGGHGLALGMEPVGRLGDDAGADAG